MQIPNASIMKLDYNVADFRTMGKNSLRSFYIYSFVLLSNLGADIVFACLKIHMQHSVFQNITFH